MDAQTRLAMARMRQSRDERTAAKKKTTLGVGITEGHLKAFASSLDRITGDEEGTLYKRWLLRRERREKAGDSDLEYCGSHHGGDSCDSCGGYGWAPMITPGADGSSIRGVAQCMECDHWEAAIEAGVEKFVADKEYRKRCERRQREFYDVGITTLNIRNGVAKAIVERGRVKFGAPKRKAAVTFGDL